MIVRSKLDKNESRFEASIENNDQWSTGNSVTGISISIQPRINGDGTISTGIGITTPTVKSPMHARCRPLEICAIGADSESAWLAYRRPGDLENPILPQASHFAATEIEIFVWFEPLDPPEHH